MMRTILIAIAMAACSAPGAEFEPGADASQAEDYQCTGADTHSWMGRHWPDGAVVEVLDLTGTSKFLVEQAVDDWNALGIPVSLVYRTESEDLTQGKIVITTEISDNPIGYATVRTEEETIISGRVATHLDMLSMTEAERLHTICQNIGHTIGLDHIEGATCMDNCFWTLDESRGVEFYDCMNDPEKLAPSAIDKCQIELSTAGQATSGETSR